MNKNMKNKNMKNLNKGLIFSNEELLEILEIYIDAPHLKPRHIAELMTAKHNKDFTSVATRKYIYDAINFRCWTALTIPKLQEYFSNEEIKRSFPKAYKVMEICGLLGA